VIDDNTDNISLLEENLDNSSKNGENSPEFVYRILNINKGMTTPILAQMRVSSFFHASSNSNVRHIHG
jgi:hypothetical protein